MEGRIDALGCTRIMVLLGSWKRANEAGKERVST